MFRLHENAQGESVTRTWFIPIAQVCLTRERCGSGFCCVMEVWIKPRHHDQGSLTENPKVLGRKVNDEGNYLCRQASRDVISISLSQWGLERATWILWEGVGYVHGRWWKAGSVCLGYLTRPVDILRNVKGILGFYQSAFGGCSSQAAAFLRSKYLSANDRKDRVDSPD